MSNLPPEELPALDDHDGLGPGPYHHSRLRTVTGQRTNPHSTIYRQRELCLGPGTPINAAHRNLELYIADVQGFDPRLRLKQPPISEWPLPKVISRVHPSGSFPQWEYPEGGVYAVDYSRVNPGMKTEPTAEWVYDLKSRLPEGSFTILDFIGKHHYVTNLWSQGPSFWQQPWLDSFDAIIVPEFSAFLDDPRPQYLIGERQKQIFAQEGWEAGKTIIPSIAWSSEASLRRQLELLASWYPHVHTVFLDALGAKVDKVQWCWSRLMMLEKYAADLPFRYIIAGVTSGWALAELKHIFPRGNYHVVNLSPFMGATFALGTEADRAKIYREQLEIAERKANGQDLSQRSPRPEIDPSLRDDHE
jgi:hypothetical protein